VIIALSKLSVSGKMLNFALEEENAIFVPVHCSIDMEIHPPLLW